MSIFDLRNNRSNLGRLALWKGSLLMYRDHFINGVGFGKFSIEYENHYRQPHTATTCHAHNNILQFMAETGSIGLIAFVWLMYSIIKLLYKRYLTIESLNWKLYLLGSLLAVIMFNIQGLTEYNFGDAELNRLFWFFISSECSYY